MGPLPAARGLELVKPRVATPIHYGTFPAVAGTAEVFRQELEKRGTKTELRILNVGQAIVV